MSEDEEVPLLLLSAVELPSSEVELPVEFPPSAEVELPSLEVELSVEFPFDVERHQFPH